MWLSIANLRYDGSWDLWLSIRYLGDWDGRSGLGLTIGYLSNGLCGLRLWLTVRDLADCGSDSSSGWLSIRGLGDFSRGACATREDVDQDRLALSGPVTVVQVVEATAQALVEDCGGTESKGAVATNREAISIDGSSLWGFIELELVVGRNIPSAAILVGELAVGKGDNERSRSSWAGITLLKSV